MMFARFTGLLLAGSFIAAAPTAIQAQTAQAPLQDRWPAPTEQLQTQPPAGTTEPTADAPTAAEPAADESVADEPVAAPTATAPEPAAGSAPAAPTPAAQETPPAAPAAPAQETPAAAPTTPAQETPAAAPVTAPPAPNAGNDTPAKAAPTPVPAPAGAKAKPAPKAAKHKASQKPSGPPTTVACSGLFGPDSSHQALEEAFKEQNLVFGEIESGSGGAPLTGSILFPDNPKRRLEVIWQDEAQRARVRVIAINGRSTWRGPKGLRLGLTLPAVQKINGKPFLLSGIDQDGSLSVTDWQEGKLASLAGGCTLGMRFTINPKASDDARSEASGDEFTSADKPLRALKPTSAEILIGYPR